MPAQYVPRTSNFTAGMVGSVYHIGLGDGTRSYGYVFQPSSGPGDTRSAMNESANIADKQALTQFSSEALIDRDLVAYPRVSQGDFSGGLLQEVFIDNTKAFDSDLEIRTPGYLMLRPAWQRKQLTTGLGAVVPQSVAFGGKVYTTFRENNKYYDSSGNVFTPGLNPVALMGVNENVLWLADGVNTIVGTVNNSSFTTETTTSGAIQQLWIVLQGTNGRFMYITPDGRTLSKLQIDSLPIGPAVAVPIGNSFAIIVDLTAYQNGVALLTTDATGDGATDVWYHDGVNMTRIIRLEQYTAVGICNCLGDLYVTGTSVGHFEAPVLMRISSGSFEVVARVGSPTATLTTASIGAPVSSGQYVYFSVVSPQINNVTSVSYVGVFDAVTNSYSHLGALDGLDSPLASGIRQLACSGRAVMFPMISSGTGYLQYQTNSSQALQQVSPQPLYATSGWMVSSKIDFQTPGIAKRFRRVEVHHTALNAGESVKVNAYVDLDPLAWTPSLAPRPSVATTTNNTVGTDVTILTLGNDASAQGSNVGRSLVYAIQLTAGTNQQTTPKVIYTAIEVGGTWVWDFDLNCTSTRRLLNAQGEDQQGINGKDLAYLIRNAYENGQPLTLFLAENVSYTVNIENYKASAPSYVDHQDLPPVRADEEWLVHVTLRQEAS